MPRLSHTLAHVTRAGQLESTHTGNAVIASAAGDLIAVVGDPTATIFPRSAIKVLQALPLIETGTADHYGLSAEELALACASHSGEPVHVATATRFLARAGLANRHLRCGAHLPLGAGAQRDFLCSDEKPVALHNNCSGKHAAMLCTACHMGEPLDSYELAHHPVQQRIRRTIEEVLGIDLEHAIPGIDGCSAPNWPLPLDRLAVAFARLVTGEGLSAPRRRAVDRLLQACWANPALMAGPGRLDTNVLTRFPDDVFIKGGAEGVFCGAIRSHRIGFAIKVDDGAKRAAEIAVGAILARFLDAARDLGEPVVLHNAAGIAVGDIRPGKALETVLEGIRITP